MQPINNDSEELKQQIMRLEEDYQRLVASISEGVSVITLDGIIASLSPAFESLTGWPPTQLIGSHFRSFIHPADLPLAIDRFQRIQNGEQLPPTKMRLLQKSGEYRIVEVSSQPQVEDGKVTSSWILVRDLTKDQQLEKQEEAIAHTKLQVQALMDLIRATSARVRSPLTSIILASYKLSRQAADSPANSSVENIERNVQYVTHLMERVLTMAELDADRVHFSYSPVQLNRLIAHIQTRFQSVAESKKITFPVKPTEDLPPVRADELRLYRAILEVIENAFEYTPEHGLITVRTFLKDFYGIVEVQDTGIGIAPELMPHLFERFFHFSLPPHVPGNLGLGLAIAKKIIEKHSGTIDVVSTPNEGSTFTIAIPLYTS
jgi:PAS domain S-box-containing protein